MENEYYEGGHPREPSLSESTNQPARDESLSQAARQQASTVWQDTRESVRSAVREQQQAAAAGVGDFAGALRHAARELDGQAKGSTARLADRAADGLERLSASLRSKDLDTMVGDIENFARREPALFLASAVAIGFLAVRFLKSSSASSEAGARPESVSRPEGTHLH